MEPTGRPPTSTAPERLVGVEAAQLLALLDVLGEVDPEASVTVAKSARGELHVEITTPDRPAPILVTVSIDAELRHGAVDLPEPAPVVFGPGGPLGGRHWTNGGGDQPPPAA